MSMTPDRRAYYLEKLAEHGPTALGVAWGSVRTQQTRFAIALEVGFLKGHSILDVGCGAGHLVDMLHSLNIPVHHYTGIDVLPEMIEHARGRWPAARFEVADLMAWEEPADLVVASGVFAIADLAEIGPSLRHCAALARHAVAANFLCADCRVYVEHGEVALTHAEGAALAGELAANWTLRHDYGTRDFTLYLYRDREESPDGW